MRWRFTFVALWLGCILAATPQPALAVPWLREGEALHYHVLWGPLNIGKASLSFTPAAANRYLIEANAKDTSMWVRIRNTWRAEGQRRGQRWQSKVYTAQQAENDYRADKRVSFSAASALYENLLGSEPSVTTPLPPGALDVLSTLYRLRAGGLAALAKPQRLPVMTLKSVFTMETAAAVREDNPKILAGRPALWRVAVVGYPSDPAKKPQHWTIWLSDDASLVPVRIETRIRLGTVTALLRPDGEAATTAAAE